MLGYCKECDRLVNITVKKRFGKVTTWHYFPIPHDAADGKLCPGDKKEI